MNRSLRLTFGVLYTLIALTAVASAQTTPNGEQRWRALTNGKYAFDIYCAQCHGTDGTGNGSLAKENHLPVPDLTTMESRNGGFDEVRVVEKEWTGCIPTRCYDVAPDGQQFYFVVRPQPTELPLVTHINLAENWVEELKAKVPSGSRH
jgi:hypothetical protein